MNRVTIITGSRNIKSRNYIINKKIIEGIENQDTDYTIITPFTFDLQPCIGCKQCFSTGKCTLDNKDEGSILKKELIDSDLIIVNSPVYVHNVSSDIKKILDRLAYWTHIFRLLGKHIIILTTTDTNGELFVNEYLSKIFSYMGINVLDIETFYLTDIQEITESKIKNIIKLINNFFIKGVSYKPNPLQEAFFQQLKYIYTCIEYDSYESKYWKEQGFMDSNGFLELLNNQVK